MKQPSRPAAIPFSRCRRARSPLYGAAAVAALAQLGSAQVTISIDWKSRSISLPSTPPQSQPMTEGDLLGPAPGALKVPPAPAPRPVVRLTGAELGLSGYPTCPLHATVRNQGNTGIPAPVFEACADVFVDTNLPSGPLGPVGGAVPNNVGALDGNGQVSSNGYVYPGLGLIEPNNPQNPPPP